MPVTINGTTGIVTPALVNGTALSFRNKIINGNFAINQRVYVSGTATSASNQYTLDRWRVVTSGQNLTFSASGNGNSVTAPAGGIEQVIEAANIEGGTYTLSWTGTATATVNGSAIVNGGQATIPANTNATIKFSSGTVSLVQLEVGSVATPFEQRPIGTELALCQRYYEKSYNINIAPGAVLTSGDQFNKGIVVQKGISTSDFQAGSNISFQVRKRAIPVVRLWAYNGVVDKWRANTPGSADAEFAVDDISMSESSCRPSVTVSSVGNWRISGHYDAEAEL